MMNLNKMDQQREDIDIEELKYELGTVCCGHAMRWENDGIGICGNCHEWSNYNDITEENIEEWL